MKNSLYVGPDFVECPSLFGPKQGLEPRQQGKDAGSVTGPWGRENTINLSHWSPFENILKKFY